MKVDWRMPDSKKDNDWKKQLRKQAVSCGTFGRNQGEFESGMPNIFIEEVHRLLPAHVLLLLNMRRRGHRAWQCTA